MTAGFTGEDHRFMAHALRLAERGMYTTDPNPRVGCVLVREGRQVGEGWHRKAGEPHAERLALAQAGTDAHGATAYVTLEPCAHHGRTPPCADALIAAGVTRVIAAMRDPNPLVAGKGLAKLNEAGVETRVGLHHDGRLLVGQVRDGDPWQRHGVHGTALAQPAMDHHGKLARLTFGQIEPQMLSVVLIRH